MHTGGKIGLLVNLQQLVQNIGIIARETLKLAP